MEIFQSYAVEVELDIIIGHFSQSTDRDAVVENVRLAVEKTINTLCQTAVIDALRDLDVEHVWSITPEQINVSLINQI